MGYWSVIGLYASITFRLMSLVETLEYAACVHVFRLVGIWRLGEVAGCMLLVCQLWRFGWWELRDASITLRFVTLGYVAVYAFELVVICRLAG